MQTPDSAGTATQFLCGIKTNYGVVGVDGSTIFKNCSSMTPGSKLTSILDWSIQKGKSNQLVFRARISLTAIYSHKFKLSTENINFM